MNLNRIVGAAALLLAAGSCFLAELGVPVGTAYQVLGGVAVVSGLAGSLMLTLVEWW